MSPFSSSILSLPAWALISCSHHSISRISPRNPTSVTMYEYTSLISMGMAHLEICVIAEVSPALGHIIPRH